MVEIRKHIGYTNINKLKCQISIDIQAVKIIQRHCGAVLCFANKTLMQTKSIDDYNFKKLQTV